MIQLTGKGPWRKKKRQDKGMEQIPNTVIQEKFPETMKKWKVEARKSYPVSLKIVTHKEHHQDTFG